MLELSHDVWVVRRAAVRHEDVVDVPEMLLGLLEVLLVVREQAQVLADQRRRRRLLPLVRRQNFQGAVELAAAALVIFIEQVCV